MKTTVLVAVMFPFMASANVGVDSKEILVDCSGQMEVIAAGKEYVSPGMITRAGHERPPKGHFELTLKASHLSPGCAQVIKKLGLDLLNKSFTSSQFTISTDLDEIKILSKSKIGEKIDFKIEQSFLYKTEAGHLPFFPLIHEETLNIKTSKYMLQPYSVQVDEAKAYGIVLNEEKKVQLTNMIFEHFEKNGLQTTMSKQLLHPLVNNYPSFQNNFKNYLAGLLKVYETLESNQEPGSYVNFELLTVAKGVIEISHDYPEVYSLKIPELMSVHPSLWISYGKQINVTATQLEEAIDLLEQKLSSGEFTTNQKAAFERPLKSLAAGYYSGSLEKLASKYTKEKAKTLLQIYF